MPVKRCPHCKSHVVYDKHDVDVQHDCNSGNATLDNEDAFDVTSSFFVGMANKLQGRASNLDTGAQLHSKTSRGNHVDTHFTRQKRVHIDLKTNSWSENPV